MFWSGRDTGFLHICHKYTQHTNDKMQLCARLQPLNIIPSIVCTHCRCILWLEQRAHKQNAHTLLVGARRTATSTVGRVNVQTTGASKPASKLLADFRIARTKKNNNNKKPKGAHIHTNGN